MSGRQPETESSETEGQVRLQYSLGYDEAFDAFLLLAARRGPGARKVVGAVLLALAAVLTVLYALNPYRLEYLVLPWLVLATFAGLTYYPRIKAHRGAKTVERAKGVYRVTLLAEGFLELPDGGLLPLGGDADARAFESDAFFVIRPDRAHTFCLPKRAMNQDEIALTRGILKEHLKFSRRSAGAGKSRGTS